MDKKICLVALNVRSTYNVGAFFRLADGLGVDIILIGITPRPAGLTDDNRLPHIIHRTTKAISKTALGAENTVKWKYFREFNEAFSWLKENSYHVTALEQSKISLPISQAVAETKQAIVVGPEIEGLSIEIIKQCDSVYDIPMKGSKESLNVSTAAAIAIYQLQNY